LFEDIILPGVFYKNIKVKVVTQVVELDAMKSELQTYVSPLAEVRDSL
jgi:hypothetical protein